MDIASTHQQWYVTSIFIQLSLVHVVSNMIFIGPRRGIDQWWFLRLSIDLVRHLEQSIWTFDLEHAVEAFSLATYLNWFDYDFEPNNDYVLDHLDFPEKFLHWLERKVSNPCSKTKFLIQLLILIRENTTFITTIACVTWSMLTPPSTTPHPERNSVS